MSQGLSHQMPPAYTRCHVERQNPDTDILQRTNSSSMEATLARRQLRWAEHVIRMPSHRLPRQVLYGQIYAANRRPSGQKRRYKGYLKGTLKSCGINPRVLETTATNRQAWSSALRSGDPTDRITASPTQNCASSAQTPTHKTTTTSIPTQHSHVLTLAGQRLSDWALKPPSMAPSTAAAVSTFQQHIQEVTSSSKSMDCIRSKCYI